MTAVEQIAFRWQRDSDFGPIAWSADDQRFRRDWKSLIATIAAPPAGVGAGHRSLVYLVYPDRGHAAIIERSFDADALAIGEGSRHEDGGRHALVAHALVGPVDVVGVDLALACERHGLAEFGLRPGRIRPGEHLRSLAPDALTCDPTDMTGVSRTPPGLYMLIAAVLSEPARPVAAFVPDERSPRPATPGDYLYGLRHTAGRLLAGTDVRWSSSFSTYEAHADRDAGLLPHVVFRDIGTDREPRPTNVRAETRILLPRDAGTGSPQGFWEELGHGLAQAYAFFGPAGLAAIFAPLVDQHTHLHSRIHAVLTATDLAGFFPPGLATQAEAVGAVPRGRAVPRAAAERPSVARRHGNGQENAPRPEPAPAGARRDPRSEGYFAPRAPEPGMPARRPASHDLIDLYRESTARRGQDGFFELLELICAIAGHGTTVPEAEAESIITLLNNQGWYVPDLEHHYGDRAAARLSWLISPLVAGRTSDEKLVRRIEERIARPETPGTWTEAVMHMYARHQDVERVALGNRLTQAMLHRVGALARATNGGVPRPANAHPDAAPHEGTPTEPRADPRSADFWVRAMPVPRWMVPAVAVVVLTLVALLVW